MSNARHEIAAQEQFIRRKMTSDAKKLWRSLIARHGSFGTLMATGCHSMNEFVRVKIETYNAEQRSMAYQYEEMKKQMKAESDRKQQEEIVTAGVAEMNKPVSESPHWKAAEANL